MERKTVNLFDVIFRGTAEYQTRAEKMVAEALATKGADAQVKLPDTAYALPCIYAITGEKITTVGELEHALELGRERVNRTTMLQSALDAGVASIIFCEIIQAIKYLDGNPHEEWVDGSLTDAVVRSFGVALVTQDIPGVAVIIGKHKDPEQLAKTIKSYQNKGLQTYLVGECIDQAREQNIKMGVELRVIPCGYEIEDVINVVSV
ncbi:MAG: CO dehydrogenase/CO-methylating acetyl-CoA synthase complex subunit beta, partial [Eubacterium sp.]